VKLKQIACVIQQVIKDRKKLQEVISRTGWETLCFHSRGVANGHMWICTTTTTTINVT